MVAIDEDRRRRNIVKRQSLPPRLVNKPWSNRAASWSNRLTSEFQELQKAAMAFDEVARSASWRAPGLSGVENVSAAPFGAQKDEVLSQIDYMKDEFLACKFGGELRVVQVDYSTQFLMTRAALSSTMFPPEIVHHAASFGDVHRLMMKRPPPQKMKLFGTIVLDTGPSSGTVQHSEEEWDHSISIKSISDSLISACKELAQAVHCFETNCARHVFELEDRLKPILKLISRMTVELDQLRRATATTAKLLVRVSATTPAGFEAMSTTVLVAPLSSFPDIGSIQSKVRQLLSTEVVSRLNAESRIASATFSEFPRAIFKDNHLCESNPPPLLFERFPCLRQVTIPSCSLSRFVLVEEVDGPRGSGVFALVFSLTYGNRVVSRDRPGRPWLRLIPVLWYLPFSEADTAASVSGDSAGAGAAANVAESWVGDSLDQFTYVVNAASCEPSALFYTPFRAFNHLYFDTRPSAKYSFRAGVDAAKGMFDMLEKFRKLENLSFAYDNFRRHPPAVRTEQLGSGLFSPKAKGGQINWDTFV